MNDHQYYCEYGPLDPRVFFVSINFDEKTIFCSRCMQGRPLSGVVIAYEFIDQIVSFLMEHRACKNIQMEHQQETAQP